jgi:two-component system cell cycle sensor histidine kinase/response regulator CckA
MSRENAKQKLTKKTNEIRVSLIEYATNHDLKELMIKVLDEICDLVDSPIGFYHFVEAGQKNLSLQQWSTRTLVALPH